MGDLERNVRAARVALQNGDGGKRKKTPLNPHKRNGAVQKKASDSAKTQQVKLYSQLAREHRLCYKCTQHCPDKNALEAHKKKCAGSPDVFRENMKIVQKLHNRGDKGVKEIKKREPVLPDHK